MITLLHSRNTTDNILSGRLEDEYICQTLRTNTLVWPVDNGQSATSKLTVLLS